MKRLLRQKRYSIPLGLVSAYLLLGFLAVGPLVRSQLLSRLPAALHRPVSIESVRWNPLLLALTVRGARIEAKDQSTLLSFDELLVDLAGTQLLQGIIGFDEIRLQKPLVGVILLQDGSLSIADLLESGPPEPAPATPSKARVVRIAHLAVTEGALAFADHSRPTPYHAEVKPLAFELSDFSTEPGIDSAYRFNARVGATQLRWSGDLTTSPLASKGEFAIEGLELPGFAPYLQGRTQLVLAAGRATLSSRYTLAGSALALQDAVLAVTGLALQAPREARALVSLDTLEVRAKTIDLPGRAVALESVRLDGGRLDVRTLPSGALELAELAGASAPAASPPAGKPWRLTLPTLSLQHLAVAWSDQSLGTPATVPLERVSLEVTDLELPLARPFQVRLGAGLGAGSLSVSGPVGLDPLTATLQVRLDALPLEPLWPYAREALDLALTDGSATFAGQVTLGGQRTEAQGDLHLDALRLEDPVAEPLFTAERLELAQLKVATPPLALELGTVALTRARLGVKLDAQGGLEAAKLVRTRPAPAAAAPGPAAPPPTVRVGLVRLDDVRLDLLDRSVSPPGALSLQRLTARVRNLTHPRRTLMPVDVTARVDGAPLAIHGTVKPAGQESLADLAVTLSGYELPLAAAYSVKYVAQPIQKGKLSLDLVWRVTDHRLDARNRIRVDQLDFGDAVAEPGPDASRLPLGLAVAILSDRTGLIDLTVPMEGDLADPRFGWLSVAVTALKNILVKVATAPFSLLAGLVEGDPEALKTVAFAPGESTPLLAERAKLDSLTNVLTARPALKVELTPHAALDQDRGALTRRQLRASLASRLDVDGGAEGLDESTWRRWVLESYRTLRPDAGEPAPAAAEQAVLEARAVGPEQLEALRRERAEAVLAGLTLDGGVSVDRVFLTLDDVDADAGTGQAAVTIDLK